MVVSFREVVGALLSFGLHCVRAPSVETVKPVTDSAAGRALSARAFRRRNFFLARTAYLATSSHVFCFKTEDLRDKCPISQPKQLLTQEILLMWENICNPYLYLNQSRSFPFHY